MGTRSEAIGLVLLPAVLGAVTGRPSLAGLRSADPLAPLLAVLGLLAWACVTWLLVVLAVTWFARTGRPRAAALLRVLAPASVRWAARAALGLAVGAGSLTAAPALAAPVAPPPIDLDWTPAVRPPVPTTPSTPTRTAGPAPATAMTSPLARTSAVPAVQPTRAAPVGRVVARRPTASVVVRRGDSLWAIAARSLRPSASNRQIANAWPRWWQTNRKQIGNNPDLIRPGAVLLQPANLGES